jgi:hypothetical protein
MSQRSILRGALLLFQAVATAATIAGVNSKVLDPHTAAPWIVAGALILLQLGIYYLLVGRHRHRLTEETAKFARHFQRWYARDGEHLIYCDDLRWLEATDCAVVVDQLKKQPERTQIWLRDDSSPRCHELRSAGVAVRQVPDSAQLHVALSLHVDGDSRELMVRGKPRVNRQGRRVIKFVDTRERNLVALAYEFFHLCALCGDT